MLFWMLVWVCFALRGEENNLYKTLYYTLIFMYNFVYHWDLGKLMECFIILHFVSVDFPSWKSRMFHMPALWHGTTLSGVLSVVPGPRCWHGGTTRYGTAQLPCVIVLCLIVLCCNTPGVMVTKTSHVIICIAKHSCLSQLWCASTKTSLHFLGWLSSCDVWLESKTLVSNAILNTCIMPYVIWGVKLCFTLVSSVGDKLKCNP
jgi:hypothetical protein